MEIRETKLSDYGQIFTLLKQEDMTFEFFTKKKFSDMLKRNKGFYLVVAEGDKIIGSIFATHDGGYYGYVYKLIVRKDYRQKGVASMLLREVLNKLRDIPWIFAHIEKTNKTSLNLFKKFGLNIRKTHNLVDIYKGSD
jgi:ribosomal protein S18 acetylase RimI-like enzyme